jgi:pyruvate dehydrogenase E2 component (dihydrolipoamide acetyltransferase)
MTAQSPNASHLDVPTYDYSLFGDIKEQPLDNTRQIIGKRLLASWQNIPHVTHHDDIDITDLEASRDSYNAKVSSDSGKLSTLACIIKSCIAGLKQFPDFNASLDPSSKTIILKEYYNIGIAVDSPVGLIVPVLKQADKLSLIEVVLASQKLAEQARAGTLGFADVEGGSFTVTSLGKMGGTGFTPIINAPEVAIMGVSKMQFKPVEYQGEIALRKMLPLSLSYDHRVIDGAKAAHFMAFIRERLQSPRFLEE